MNYRVFLFFALTVLSPLATAGSICDSSITRELEACAKSNFYDSDKKLNEEYKELSAIISAPQRQSLVDVQREWIKYKEAYCQEAFDVANPGEEAGVDKWSCLDEVTRVRTKELMYLRSATDVEDFYHAVAFVAEVYENGNKGKVFDKLNSITKGGDNAAWLTYVQKNCQLTAARLHEDRKVCVARQNFYRNWFQ